MTKKEKEARAAEAIAFLKTCIKPGDRVYTVLNHVSSSGMSRRISVVIPEMRDGKLGIFNISGWVANALDYKRSDQGGMIVGGVGMDMGFHLVYSLSRTLFRDTFTCTGEGCPSNDHANGDPKGYEIGHKHSDGGYALTHSWV